MCCLYTAHTSSMSQEITAPNIASQPVPAAATVHALYLVASDHAPPPLPPDLPAPGPGLWRWYVVSSH